MVFQRDAISKLPAYKQGVAPGDSGAVKLSSNENPFAPLPSVVTVIAEALSTIHLYPSMSAPELTERLAARYDIDAENLAFGAGSVEVASQLIHASAGAGDEVIFAWRSFEAYPILVQVAGATPIPVPLTDGDRHDLPAMAAAITARTRLIFVCNPNNPTGATVTTAEMHDFLARVPENVLVVIDEAYVHFNRDPDSAIGLDFFKQYPNVAVLHTFSKAYGLAGLRLGYAIAPASVAANLRRVSVPFGVSDLAQRAGVASLDAEHELNLRVDILVDERTRVLAGLRAQGWTVADSHANFVWLRTGDDTDRVNAALIEQGILGRAFPGEGIRVSTGSIEANDRFLAAAASLASGSPGQ
ncbi:histidinol-phosphate transaminase [Glaciibacter psychrotolerans]|uniref:Aromatic amino acid aminotransferase n=1 Tax=Glaciibacter psychrotolerans TaxID=670054 RepID=A0A7Z0J6U7_9MICO|nr:histidinol-phosphate transaminase [Leifsonia psychrotolerans]NYJ20932.1 histidinol-phosphate aminotransferase [Leifsonia psychrotolerans]